MNFMYYMDLFLYFVELDLGFVLIDLQQHFWYGEHYCVVLLCGNVFQNLKGIFEMFENESLKIVVTCIYFNTMDAEQVCISSAAALGKNYISKEVYQSKI